MKKTLRIAVLVCLVTLVCSLIFVACDSGNNTQTSSTTNEEATKAEETTEEHISYLLDNCDEVKKHILKLLKQRNIKIKRRRINT